jgi:hypothetical protein
MHATGLIMAVLQTRHTAHLGDLVALYAPAFDIRCRATERSCSFWLLIPSRSKCTYSYAIKNQEEASHDCYDA